MADDTGGRVIDVHNEKSLEKAFDEISRRNCVRNTCWATIPTNLKRDGTPSGKFKWRSRVLM
jgi:hypothetical protein